VLLILYQKVDVSMMAGKAMPSAAKHKAPKREMNSSRLGIATARRTVNKDKWKVKHW